MRKDQRFYHSLVLMHQECTVIRQRDFEWLTFWDCFFAAGLPVFYGVSLLQEQQSDGMGWEDILFLELEPFGMRLGFFGDGEVGRDLRSNFGRL